jgi:MoxR-like ATPase
MEDILKSIKTELTKKIKGKDDIIELILIAVLCDGHVLLEGLPGTAKTTLVNNFSKIFNTIFKRIQFTPDLLPSDIIGTYIFNQRETDFEFVSGPIFANFVLADEINRSSPKTQAALLESMAEKQVTVNGDTFKLESPFIVIATQNPIEMEGTYPLPEAQLDRFLFKIPIYYPLREDEFAMLKMKNDEEYHVKTLFDKKVLLSIKENLKKIYVSDQILFYIINIIEKTRQSAELFWGAGPRASIALLEASKAKAFLKGRNYVIPDDVKELTYPILRHRIKMQETDITSNAVDQLIWRMLKNVPVPRIK